MGDQTIVGLCCQYNSFLFVLQPDSSVGALFFHWFTKS